MLPELTLSAKTRKLLYGSLIDWNENDNYSFVLIRSKIALIISLLIFQIGQASCHGFLQKQDSKKKWPWLLLPIDSSKGWLYICSRMIGEQSNT